MVYFIQAESGSIKIGYSRSAIQRLNSLQSSNAEKLTLIGTINGSREKEYDLHKQFAHLLIGGEWFRPDVALLEYIALHKEDVAEEGAESVSQEVQDLLFRLAKNIKLARLRRKMTQQALADLMGTGLRAIMNIEDGKSGTSLGNYLTALSCLGLLKDFEHIGTSDEVGRKLQDEELMNSRGRD
jgi:DNA-binding XRE family transcriptional regulator